MKLLLVGHGRMGKMLEELITLAHDLDLAGFIDSATIRSLGETERIADAVIDFSAPSALPWLLEYITRTGTALISGTTGYSQDEFNAIRSLGFAAPVLYSANYSIGIAVMKRIAAQMAEALPGFDIEIVETHHNRKADAPSGTAKLLAEAVDPHHALHTVHGRQGLCGPRQKNELGIHSIRGGSVAGEHTVNFFGEDEVLSIAHSAASRRVFASGALRAARVITTLPAGFYTLEELLFRKEP